MVSWKNGKKEHLQKRHLLFSLREAHALFLKENPEVKIGLSKFSSLRPLNVLLSSGIPRNVCSCQYHESIKLICDCLKKEIPKFPNYSGDFVEKFVCSSDSEACMFGRCAKCPDWLKTITEEVDLEGPATWYEWKRVETVSPTASKKDSKTMKVVKKVKISKEGIIGDAVESLQGKLPSFLEHVFIKRQQSKFFEERLAKPGPSEAVIQVEFAENYTCKHQDEPQSAHWNQEQVSLFTLAIWAKEAAGVDNVCESYDIVSDEMMHDKKAVAVFMFHVVDQFIKKRHQNVKQVYVFSDGPSSQFKNKYIAHFLHTLNKIVPIQWNYFATSHGKGVVDGIVGTLKRLVSKAVMTGKSPVVADTQSFYRVASSLTSSVTVSIVSQKEITDTLDLLSLEKCFSEALPLRGISKMHYTEPRNDGNLSCCDVFPYESDDDMMMMTPFQRPSVRRQSVQMMIRVKTVTLAVQLHVVTRSVKRASMKIVKRVLGVKVMWR